MRASLITIQAEQDRHFTITGAGRKGVGFCWDEMLGAVASLTHPDIANPHPGLRPLPGLSSGEMVTLTLERDQVERLSEGMSDLLCWCEGFKSSRPGGDGHPYGVEETRRMRLILLSVLRQSRPDTDSEKAA